MPGEPPAVANTQRWALLVHSIGPCCLGCVNRSVKPNCFLQTYSGILRLWGAINVAHPQIQPVLHVSCLGGEG